MEEKLIKGKRERERDSVCLWGKESGKEREGERVGWTTWGWEGGREGVLARVNARGLKKVLTKLHKVRVVWQVLEPWPGRTPQHPATVKGPSPTSNMDMKSAHRYGCMSFLCLHWFLLLANKYIVLVMSQKLFVVHFKWAQSTYNNNKKK